MTTLLVTVGSTLFNDLIHAVLENTTLRLLSSLGVKDLVVQYGMGKLPSGLFQKGEVNAKGEGRVVFRIKQAGSEGEGEALGVRVLRFTDDLGGLIEASNAVVSHAGSGTILQTLRTPRPLLVVPNTKLMDNHQMELATALEVEKYVLVCTSEVEKLQATLKQLLSSPVTPLKQFPALRPEAFRSIVDEAMGFE